MMDEHAIRKMLEGGGGVSGTFLRAGLWIPGKLYGLAMLARRHAYRNGILHSFRPPVPVVSIGNLTAGGSGKTPFTIMLARELVARGRKPGILLRGYRRSGDGLSDEAALYGERCPGALVEVDSDRRAGAARAVAAGADVLLMDDGFQHLRLQRDVDIVLVDATAPWGGGNTIPGGLLREPRSALREATMVVITRADQVPVEVVTALNTEIFRLAPQAAILVARHQPARLRRLDNSSLELSELAGRDVVAISGIARPEAFHRTLEGLGARIVSTLNGRDHDHFGEKELSQALVSAREKGAVAVITEKDRVKNIFCRLADNNSVDNNNVVDSVWTLGVEQEVNAKAMLFGLLFTAIEKSEHASG